MPGHSLLTIVSLYLRFHHPPGPQSLCASNDRHPSGWVHYRCVTRHPVPAHPRAICQPLKSPCRQLTTIILPYLVASSTREMARLRAEVAIVGLHCSGRRASRICAPHLGSVTRGTVHSHLIQQHQLFLSCRLHVRMEHHVTTSPCPLLCRIDKTLRLRLPKDLHNKKS